MKLTFIRVKVAVGDGWLASIGAGYFITDNLDNPNIIWGPLRDAKKRSLLFKSNWIESEWNRFPDPGPDIGWFEEVTFELKEIETKPL